LAKKEIFDENSEFVYSHEIKKGLLKLTLMRFGEYSNYTFGLKWLDVPKFRRVQK
jgi:hypothetical protein